MSEILRYKRGVIQRAQYYRERNVHLISNYWGLDSLMESPLPKRKINLAFISTASQPYPLNNEPCNFLNAERAWLQRKKADGRLSYFEYCISGKNADQIRKDLQNIDVLFVGGGNTAYLLQKIQESGARQVFRELWEDKVTYFGKSAGAIIAGPDIEPWGFILKSMATKKLATTQGLGFTDAFPLPHIDSDSFMHNTYNGKNGYRHLAELAFSNPVVCLVDNTSK